MTAAAAATLGSGSAYHCRGVIIVNDRQNQLTVVALTSSLETVEGNHHLLHIVFELAACIPLPPFLIDLEATAMLSHKAEPFHDDKWIVGMIDRSTLKGEYWCV